MLLVKDLMPGAVESITADATLHDALRRMNLAGYRHLPVVHDGDLIGIVTDRDLRLAVNSPVLSATTDPCREELLDEMSVGECMTPDPQCVSPETPARDVAEILALNKFGAMPVVDDGTLVGMISYVDFLRHFSSRQ